MARKGPSANLKKCLDELKTVSQISNKDKQRKMLVKLSKNNCFYEAIREASVNTLAGNVPIDEKTKRKLSKHASVMKLYKRKRTQAKSKTKLISQSGGFLGVLIPILASVLAETVMK